MNKNTSKNEHESAVVYARYSSHNQGEQSIDGQLSAARDYAAAKGYTIIHEYVDRAMTGRNDNRDEFQRMLSDCAQKQFTVIIVWKVDRFGRNREEITFNKYRAKKNGVRVEYVAETITEGPEGVILESVLEGMAEYYSLQLSQNITRGLYESAKKYRITSGLPAIGYKKGADGRYEIDPDKAPVVKQIFEMYTQGMSTRAIAKHFELIGFRNSRGRSITHSNIREILKNERYTGVYIYKDLIREEGVIPPIIDKETFQKAQETMDRNRTMPSNKWIKVDYILTGKLFCGKCGTAMAGTGSRRGEIKYTYYICQAHHKWHTCDKKGVNSIKLENAVLTRLQEILKDDDIMDYIAECTWQYYLATNTDHEQAQVMEKQLAATEKSIANLVRSLESGLVSQTITDRIAELETQKTALKKALADLSLERGLKLTKEHILFFLEQFKNLDYTDRECQKRLIDVFVNAIYLYDDYMRIAFNYGDSESTLALSDLEGATDKNFVHCVENLSLSVRTL